MNSSEELNKKAVSMLDDFYQCGTKESLDHIDSQITVHDPNDKNFYKQMGSQASDLSNQITEMYYELLADKGRYFARRMFELNVEFNKSGTDKTMTVNGELIHLSRSPGKDTIESAVNCELSDLCWTIDFIKGHLLSSMNTIKTCRNHTYNSGESVQPEKHVEN